MDMQEGEPPNDNITEAEWDDILYRFSKGALIPFLGAGASAYASPFQRTPPSGRELLDILARSTEAEQFVYCQCSYPHVDLARVASYKQTLHSRDILNRKLVQLLTGANRSFDDSAMGFEPNDLHMLVARIAKRCPMLIITTNYDKLIEDAFDKREVPYEVMATPIDYYSPGESLQDDRADLSSSRLGASSPGAEAGTIWHRLGKVKAEDDREEAG